eukprot:gene16186-11578_t
MDDKSISSSRKSPKKVYQAFGTANHSKHAYSEFAHLDSGSRSFATGIASTKEHVIIPEPEEEEQPKKRRPASRKAKKPQQQKKAKEEGQEGEDSVDEEKNDEECQPCTKIPCQQVMRVIAELELKNEGERLDLEDEADRLTQDLQQSMQEIIQSEGRLAKLNELGDQLEMAVSKILSQVEALEHKNQSLADERTEINSKLMLLEVERQKQNRKLEKMMKQVTDARWRKKKKAQQQDAENGLSYPPSEISEHKIIQKDSATVKRDLDVTFTKYNALARDQVVDYLERPPTLKTVHPVLAEDFLVSYPQDFDKYAQKHYRQQISTSIESWESIQETTVACDVRKHPKYPQYHQSSPSQTRDTSPSHTMFQSASMSTISKHTPSLQSLKKPLSTIANAGPGANHPETAAQQRVGQTLSSQVSREVQHRRQLVDTMHSLVHMVQQNPQQVKGPGFKLPPSAAATVFHDPDALKLERPVSPTSRPTTRDALSDQNSLTGDHQSLTASLSGSVMNAASSALARRLNYKPKFEKKTKGAGLQLSKSHDMVSLSGSGKIRLTPLNINGPSSAGSDGGFGLQLGHLMDQDQQEEEYLEKMEQDGIFLPTLGQSPEPIGHNSSGVLSSSVSFYSNTGPSEQKPRIDDVFYKPTAQTHWGRGHKLGEVRAKPPNHIIHTVVHPITEHSGDTGGGGKQSDTQIKKKAPKITYKTVSGLTVVDMRQLPRLHARTLTVEHPGMPTFESAQDLFAGGPGGVVTVDESTSRTK